MPYSIVLTHIFFCLLEIYNVLNVTVNFHFYFRFFDIFLYLSLSYCKSTHPQICLAGGVTSLSWVDTKRIILYTDFVAKFYNNFPQPVTT